MLNLTVYSRWVLVRHVGGSEGSRRFRSTHLELRITDFEFRNREIRLKSQIFFEDFGNFGNFLIQSSEMGLLLSEEK